MDERTHNNQLEDKTMIKHRGAQEFYSLEELSSFPTISNQKPAEKLSQRYGFVPTIEVATALYDQGWMAREVKESVVRSEAKQGQQKHMIRFARDAHEHDPYSRMFKRAGLQLEIVFFGSHDGSTKFKLYLGFLRFVCFNETVNGDMLEQFCFVHRQHARIKADDAIKAVNAAVPGLSRQLYMLQNIGMTPSMQYAYAKRSLEIKHGDDWFDSHSTDIQEFLKPQRVHDVRPTLFNVYNRCQERLMHGGYRFTSDRKENSGMLNAEYLPGKVRTAKPVKDITLDLRVNQGLWKEALGFASNLCTR